MERIKALALQLFRLRNIEILMISDAVFNAKFPVLSLYQQKLAKPALSSRNVFFTAQKHLLYVCQKLSDLGKN